jgi:uncharacterized protein YbjT (DUF2867 family)
MNVILTGATGLVGEGVLLTCLEHPIITQVLAVGRKASGIPDIKILAKS